MKNRISKEDLESMHDPMNKHCITCKNLGTNINDKPCRYCLKLSARFRPLWSKERRQWPPKVWSADERRSSIINSKKRMEEQMAKKKEEKVDIEEVKELLEDYEDAESDEDKSEMRKIKRSLRKMGLTIEQAKKAASGGDEDEEVEVDYDLIMSMKKKDMVELIEQAEIDIDPDDFPSSKKLRAELLKELDLTEEKEEKADSKDKGKVTITIGKKKTELKAGDKVTIVIN